MAKEVAIGKRAKISEAQQNMILAVAGASIILGIAISLTVHFAKQIIFNASVIAEEEKSIAAYTDVIKKTGVCKAPKGSVYSDEEIKACNPSTIEVSEIPGTLRANILENLASNAALNSVSKEDNSSCRNINTGKTYTYKELNNIYKNANNAKALAEATQLIKSCSALRIIPDALPAFRNEEALLASLNKLFIISNWEPESLNPSGSSGISTGVKNLKTISIILSVEADTGTTMNVLSNIERSIREFDIERATIEWGGDNTLVLNAQANAYYMETSTISEVETTIKPEEAKK